MNLRNTVKGMLRVVFTLLILPLYFIFAYVSGLVVRKSRSLLPAIVMHAVFNAAAVSVLASTL